MGRVTEQEDKDENGTVIYHRWLGDANRQDARDGNGQVWKETIVQRRGTDTVTTYNTYSYGTRGTLGYALGQVTGVGATVATLRSGGQVTTDSTGTAYCYAWYEGPTQSGVSTSTNDGTAATTTYAFNGAGTLTGAIVTGYNARSVTIVNDVLGQAIRRTEGGSSPTDERWYRFDGRQIGTVNTSGTDSANWDMSTTQRASATGSSRIDSNGDWSDNYEAYNSYSQGSAQGSYTVRAGDTLAGIAASLWGDAGLWYKIASANGLSGADTQLTAGTILQLPANVVRTTNSAATFRPYDPTEAYGDTSPTTPTPQGAGKKNKCGVFGQILLVAVAVAVTAWSAGTLSVLAGSQIIGGALAGAAGSIASQAVGNITGIQEGFSWKGVALAAIAGGVGGALKGAGDLVGGLGKATAAVNAGIRGALGSAITQGIGVATKLQSRFDFVGIAAAGVGAGIANAAGGRLGFKAGSFGDRLATNTASGIANAATRSAISGTSFGNNLLAALPDVIGGTVGQSIGEKLASIGATSRRISASVNGLKQAVFGNEPLSSDQKSALSDVSKAVRFAAAHPDDKAARSAANQAVSALLDSNSDSAGVSDFLNSIDAPEHSNSKPDDIVVKGRRSYWAGHTIDGAGIWVGERSNDIKNAAGNFLSAHPGVGVALSVANIGLTIAGGPTRYIAGLALDHFKGGVSGWLSDQLQGSDWSQAKARAGGDGFVLSGELTLNGLASVVGIASIRKAAESAPRFSRIVPGGGLAAHEAAGGHLLLKHVGQSESQLLARLAAEPKISGSSSFFDRAIAERVVAETLDANSGKIATWLAGKSNRLPVDHSFSSPVGISVSKGATSASNVSSVQLFLIRDASLSTGYRIHTGYPKP